MSQYLRKKIEDCVPFDDIEAEAKKAFLQFIDVCGEDIWHRDNLVGHVTASCRVVNKDRTKVVMAYHNLYDSWAWLGGHADGDRDTLYVSKKEAMEECGAKEVKVLSEDIMDISIQGVDGHFKRGKEVPTHLHFNVTYLLEVDEDSELFVKEDENSGVKWIRNEDVMDSVSEEVMKKVYRRLMDKAKLE